MEHLPLELLAQLINDGRTLRRVRQTCRALATLTVSGRWTVDVSVDYPEEVRDTWSAHKDAQHCKLWAETFANSATIAAGAGGDIVFNWLLDEENYDCDEYTNMYSACLAREHLNTGANPVIPYRTYWHYFERPGWYRLMDNNAELVHIVDSIIVRVDPADFGDDTINSLFKFDTYINPDNYGNPHYKHFNVLVTLTARASVVYKHFGPR